MTTVKYDAVDLFAGPGGWSEGLKALGMTDLGIEWDKAACETREAAGHATIRGDVRAFDPLDLELRTRGHIASPSCQTFSMAGKGAGRKALDDVLAGVHLLASGEPLPPYDDERTSLTLEPLRWIKARYDAGDPYEWIALEQVPTVLPVWQAYAEVLRGWGYGVETAVLHAEQYGVPQTRKRAILVARYGHGAHLPKPTHTKYRKGKPKQEEGLLPWVSMAEALSRTETMRSNYGTGGDPKNRGERLSEEPGLTVTSKVGRNQWVPTAAIPGDTSWSDVRPSPTIVGSFSPDVVASPGYRKAGDGPRQKQPGSIRVTVEEAGVLQSFPKDYPWQGSKTKRYEQCGNAIPPLLAQAIVAGVSQIDLASP